MNRSIVLSGLAVVIAACGPSREERRTAQVEVCLANPACLVAQYDWTRSDADSAAHQAYLAGLRALAKATEEEAERLVAANRAVAERREAAAKERRDAAAELQRRADAKDAAYRKAIADRQAAFDKCMARNGWDAPYSKERPVVGQVHGRSVSLPLGVHTDTFIGIRKVCRAPDEGVRWGE